MAGQVIEWFFRAAAPVQNNRSTIETLGGSAVRFDQAWASGRRRRSGCRESVLFTGDGEMASRLREFDWSGHPLGPPSSWPAELIVTLGLCLRSSMPTAVYWGPEFRLLYNDAWSHIPSDRHPWAIGRPAADVWSDIWDVVSPQLREAVSTKRGFSTYDQQLLIRRGDATVETYWNYSLTPILSPDGAVLGLLNQGNETTDRVMAARNQAFLLTLGDKLRDLTVGAFDAPAVLETVLGELGRHLDLARVGYADVVESDEFCAVAGNWRKPGVTDLAHGLYRLSDFGRGPNAEMLAGALIASDDVTVDARHSAAEIENFATVGVRANLLAPVVRNGRTIAFVFLNDDRPRRWTPRETSLAREAAERIWVALDRAQTLARLKESENRFTRIFEQASVGLSEVDLDGRFVRVNEAMGRILGRPPDSVAGLSVASVTHPEDLAKTRQFGRERGGDGDGYTIEKRYLKPDGASNWAVTNVTRILDDRGRPNRFFSVTVDVTERKEQDRIRAWLLAELNHRVKNNLSTVQSLARHTRFSTKSIEEFETVFNARLMALSRAHDLLMRETWTSAALGDLVSDTLAPFTLDDRAGIVIGGPEVRLSPTAAVTMTLAFHELATNAAKYGALSSAEGRISVEWSVETFQGGGVVELQWRETDGPAVSPPSHRGFGSRLIERGAARELGGRVTLDFEPGGVACAFRLPLSQKITVP